MLAKGLRSHSLYNSVLYILSSIKIVCMLYELLWDVDCLCSGLLELNVIVRVQHINNKKYTSYTKEWCGFNIEHY
jgi:hypothetical protein